MKTIDLGSQSPTLEELLIMAHAQAGVMLTKQGQPVAQVLPMHEKPMSRVTPLHPGAWTVREDFDAPLTEDFLLGPA